MTESPRLDSELLLAHCLGVERFELIVAENQGVCDSDSEQFYQSISQRSQGIPVAYQIGYRSFWKADFKVGPGVLIPRPESERIIEIAIQCLGQDRYPEDSLRFLDLGTGSGCLLLSLLSEYPRARGLGVDRSIEALSYARTNAVELSLQKRVHWLCSSWGDGLDLGRCQYDLIVSNPPYVTSEEYRHLSGSIRNFEPERALVAPEDGVGFHQQILKLAREILSPRGWILLELGRDQGQQLYQFAVNLGGLTNIQILKDYGGQDRVLLSRRAESLI
jgi:release factor glutamine methyltransferase